MPFYHFIDGQHTVLTILNSPVLLALPHCIRRCCHSRPSHAAAEATSGLPATPTVGHRKASTPYSRWIDAALNHVHACLHHVLCMCCTQRQHPLSISQHAATCLCNTGRAKAGHVCASGPEVSAVVRLMTAACIQVALRGADAPPQLPASHLQPPSSHFTSLLPAAHHPAGAAR